MAITLWASSCRRKPPPTVIMLSAKASTSAFGFNWPYWNARSRLGFRKKVKATPSATHAMARSLSSVPLKRISPTR